MDVRHCVGSSVRLCAHTILAYFLHRLRALHMAFRMGIAAHSRDARDTCRSLYYRAFRRSLFLFSPLCQYKRRHFARSFFRCSCCCINCICIRCFYTRTLHTSFCLRRDSFVAVQSVAWAFMNVRLLLWHNVVVIHARALLRERVPCWDVALWTAVSCPTLFTTIPLSKHLYSFRGPRLTVPCMMPFHMSADCYWCFCPVYTAILCILGLVTGRLFNLHVILYYHLPCVSTSIYHFLAYYIHYSSIYICADTTTELCVPIYLPAFPFYISYTLFLYLPII